MDFDALGPGNVNVHQEGPQGAGGDGTANFGGFTATFFWVSKKSHHPPLTAPTFSLGISNF